MKAKSGEGGRLFGSITSKQIADELSKENGIKVDRRRMDLPEPIRSLGIQIFQSKFIKKSQQL